jgi:hypothetical protein
MLVSCITVPLGFLAGAKIESFVARLIKSQAQKKLEYILSPVAFILCLVIGAMLRLT